MLTEAQLERCVAWLMRHGSAPVRYLTKVHLLGYDRASPAARELWEAAQGDPVGAEIFGKQRPDGSWCDGGPWAPKPSYLPMGGYTPVSPKYVTTVWLLSILGDMGYTVEDPRVMRACEWVMLWRRPNGVLSETRAPFTVADYDENPRNVPCRMSVQMDGLARVGFASNQRMVRPWDLLLRWQREDGGWVQEGHRDATAAPYKVWGRSCPWVSYFAASALHHSGIREYREPLREALGFILWHLDRKRPEEIRRFFWHGHDTVRELVMLGEMGFDPEQPSIRVLTDWLETMHDPGEDCFRYTGKPVSKMSRKLDGGDARVMRYRLFHMIEHDWLTYWAARAERGFLRTM
ncbi:hypothetical protein A3K69_02260 [Candidatus Bathyarchaeota archaeon RBG_16_57_9]|nr:MAG: hypothetical protein A3K69_02260 [Candidatus Bathyarchaeota archaeon RBG_16_57_9]OGD53699.1 MAG: hypothetical protein A3K81_05670 [Candidatus Bathyarchaeota archaeon RBG_13_60_20]